MRRPEKEDAVSILRENLGEGSHLLIAEYRGLTVEEVTSFRNRVRGALGTVKVAKNTLVRRAVAGTDKEAITELLQGPNALVYTKADPMTMVKAVVDGSKEFQAISIKGGVIEGRQVTPDEIRQLSDLPGREELLSRSLRSMNAPLQGLMNVCLGTSRSLVYVLEAIRQSKAA